MYAIHSTTGFIVDSRAYGEAGKMISIFTRDLGMVTAVAQGIRLEKSKLRYSAQDYSLGTFSLVRGKELWRLTSAAGEADLPTASPAARALVARIALLLRRLLQGEEAHPELFGCVEAFLSFMHRDPGLDAEQLKTLESVTVLQILHTLGYVGSDGDLSGFLEPLSPQDQGLLERAAKSRVAINRHINKALQESHL